MVYLLKLTYFLNSHFFVTLTVLILRPLQFGKVFIKVEIKIYFCDLYE